MSGYVSKETSNVIKGFAIILVFVRHVIPYIIDSGYVPSRIDSGIILIDSILNQLIVVPFLFFSGYGVAEQKKIKGHQYVSTFPRRRILGTWVNFAIAVLVFYIFSLIVGNTYTVKQIVLSFFAWDSIGNSNWYVFSILLCYLFFYIDSLLACKKKHNNYVLLSVLLLLLMITLSFVKKEWWYNTILVFAFGCFFSSYKIKIEQLLSSNYWSALIITVFSICLLYLLYLKGYQLRGITFNMISCLCCVLLIMASMKISVRSRLLEWMGGAKLFPMYIYQRLPMFLILSFFPDFVKNHSNLYILSSFAITCMISYCYKHVSLK